MDPLSDQRAGGPAAQASVITAASIMFQVSGNENTAHNAIYRNVLTNRWVWPQYNIVPQFSARPLGSERNIFQCSLYLNIQ